MKAARVIVALVATLWSLSGQAEFLDGAALNAKLNADVRTASGDVRYAEGYVAGAVDRSWGMDICPPPRATPEQAVEVVKKFLREHRDLWKDSADSLVAAALAAFWPCPPRK